MSIDLEWSSLDSSLSKKLVEILNKQLSQTSRPSFIGPVEVISLEFGSTSPDVELVDLRDIYRDFLEDDEENLDQEPVKVTEGAEDDDGFEWVPRRATRREEGLAFQQSPHLRYGRGGPMDMFASTPSLNSHMEPYNPAHSLVDYRPLHMSWPHMPMYANSMSQVPASAPANHRSFDLDDGSNSPIPNSNEDITQDSAQQDSSLEQEPPKPPSNHPNLQLHFNINWNSDLRITLTTSLLINYPSPMFMSLPIKLSVTGLIFTGEIAVAYEGERSRVHLCILDDLDPYGPAGDRPKRDASNTPPDLNLDVDEESPTMTRPSKPLPIGKRLLPSIFIESEIGQADKHVLKNVTRVERFIQDVIRKTIEEELVFPNFHTLVMGG
ncbi:hypothetical protein K435DRAFT_741083 [Dendrothele bispora CBS 962.96]|uniref:Mitochondrial distribution and morphology protein 12 n=1 Tax=Dendrothele bispora (strain CBS 962.96) TaxID=1314807 RepID=A0A4S8MYZ9_DENBC|nr:hypothetical protein K435DRAFT_741083 [Dendrothele bispora CBS 962.96]